MEYESREGRIGALFVGLALGAVIGAGVAFLTAPQNGQRTRKKIRRTAGRLRVDAGDRWEEFADDVKERVDDAVRTAKKRLPSA